jgi:hypothetical protein
MGARPHRRVGALQREEWSGGGETRGQRAEAGRHVLRREEGAWRPQVGNFTLVTPKIESYSPTTGGLDEVVTIKGSGFGKFLKTAEPSKVITDSVYARVAPELGENVSRTEVLFNGVGAIVQSWTDTEITGQDSSSPFLRRRANSASLIRT